LIRKQRYITSNSKAQVLSDNLEDHQLEIANENDDLIINQQQSERDNIETSSSDEWKFLFETVIEEENKEEHGRHPYDKHSPSTTTPKKRQSLREGTYRESQKKWIPYENNGNAFHRILRTLLDSKKYEHWKNSRLEKLNDKSKSSTIEQYLYDLMRRGEKQQEREKNKWVNDSTPNESTKAMTSSLSNIFNEIVEPKKEAIEIKNELLKCETKKQLQEFISKNIFGVGIDNESSIKSNRVVDDFNRPFPFKYEMLLKQSILMCNIKFKDPYLALSIFEQTKRRGLLSYALGCSTRVYNQILLIRWEFWKDLKGIERLLNEMKYNGISFDDETYKIISSIRLEVISYSNSEKWDFFDMKAYSNILKLFRINEERFQHL